MDGYRRSIDWKQIKLGARILQIYSKGLEYSLVSSDYKQCHPFVWCKDFLHDVVHSSVNNKEFELYRFKYDPKIDPKPCLDKIRLLIANPKDRKFSSKIPAVIDFINQIEEKLKIKKSFIRKCASPPGDYAKTGVYMIEGSKRWIQAPPMLSLYSLLIRVGFCHTVGNSFEKTIEGVIKDQIKPYQKKDNHWLKNVDPALKKILSKGDRKIFHKKIQYNYPDYVKGDSIHNHLGIIGFATDMKKQDWCALVPHWHKK